MPQTKSLGTILQSVTFFSANIVQSFHSAQALELMNRYQIGRIEGRWTNFVPPIQGESSGLEKN